MSIAKNLPGEPFSSGFAGGHFFYSDLRIQEILTTIRYGVETRKGLVIITGDSGVGKTAVLRKVAAELPANIAVINVHDVHISYAELLRLLLLELDDAENAPELVEDELAMVRRCQALLRARLDRCEIVTLTIDDAHLLPDRTMRNMMQNFLGGSAEAPDGALLQIILAGGSSLKIKLSQAALIPLRRRRPIVCEVQPLSSQEVGGYIACGLKAGDRPEDLFDERSVKRVALFAEGNPRAIEALCARALQLAGPAGTVTAELIEDAGKALDIRGSSRPVPFSAPDKFAHFAGDQNTESFEFATTPSRPPATEPAFFARAPKEPRYAWLLRGDRLSSWVRGLTMLTLVVAAAALIPAQRVVNLFAEWSGKLNAVIAQQTAKVEPLRSPPADQLSERVSGASDAEVQRMSQPDSLVPLPGPDRPAVSENPPPSSSQDSTPAASQESGPPRATEQSSSEVTPTRAPARRPSLRENRITNRDLQVEVTKAIASRAIIGVEVSVVQGTAILDGHVATERQRRAAERAALSVSGVERVRNRIAITFG